MSIIHCLMPKIAVTLAAIAEGGILVLIASYITINKVIQLVRSNQ
jgi:hypothetical protein